MLADGTVHKTLAEDGLRQLADTIVRTEVTCVLVGFLRSYTYPEQEQCTAELLREVLPVAIQVVTSVSVYSEFR